MPFRTTPKTQTPYALIAFDSKGKERDNDPEGSGGLLSRRLLSNVEAQPPSDVFVFSHGWRGDIPSAIDQYDRWIDAMAALQPDAARMGKNFRPLWVGIHWPSEPWGEEDLESANDFSVAASGVEAATDLKTAYLSRLDLTGSPEAETLLDSIFDAQRDHAAARSLPPDTLAAYNRIYQLMEFSPEGTGAEPGNDTVAFDPQSAFDAINSYGVPFGPGGAANKLLAPLRVLSFWNMKRRARTVGETGVNQLVAQIQSAVPQCSVHAMGHSFGTIVVSSLCGKEGAWLPRPIDSLALVQGAVSLWSYADKLQGKDKPGYYQPMFRKPAIRGPVITTQSTFDRAVSKFYRAAVALVLASPDFDPGINDVHWGAIGQYGIQGLPDVQAATLLDANAEYNFENGKIYNLESSQYIKKGAGASGAHSDIDGPEVAHALWQVALASKSSSGRALASAAGNAVPAAAPAVHKNAAGTGMMPLPFGIQAETGAYLPALQSSDLKHIGRDSNAPVLRGETGGTTFGVTATVNPDDLAESGWGILFSNNASHDIEAIRNALEPLLDLRKQQAGALYSDFSGDSGYVTGLDAGDWLAERGSGLAPVDPKQGVPYYLLLVGSPQDIPFEFQYDLDTFFAVGRLYFPSIEEYRRYAENMVAYEGAKEVPHAKSAAVFATRNPGDEATQMLHDLVAMPLANGDAARAVLPLGQRQGYKTIPLLAAQAKKSDLLKLLAGQQDGGYPALLFTGSHGVAFRPDDPSQAVKQGAILTQDWRGFNKPAAPEAYLTAAELEGAPSVSGMIHYFFACYSAACPVYDTYTYDVNKLPKAIASQPFIARLPQQLLLNGAQAVIGHVDRAWAYSFQSGKGITLSQNFRDPMERILQGSRVGDAMDAVNQRWSVLSGQLTTLLNRRAAAKTAVSDARLANCWVERDDARNYIILGDPASKLRTS